MSNCPNCQHADHVRVLHIDDMSKSLLDAKHLKDPTEIMRVPIKDWMAAQVFLADGQSADCHVLLIDINFSDDDGAPSWSQYPSSRGGGFGKSKPTGLFIGLSAIGTHASDIPRVVRVVTKDPSTFADDPAALTAAGLIRAALDRTVGPWEDLGAWLRGNWKGDNHAETCADALDGLRKIIVRRMATPDRSGLTVNPSTHLEATYALEELKKGRQLGDVGRSRLSLEFLTVGDTPFRLNLKSLFADKGLEMALEEASDFLTGIAVAPDLLRKCSDYAKRVQEDHVNIYELIPEGEDLERVVTLIFLLTRNS